MAAAPDALAKGFCPTMPAGMAVLLPSFSMTYASTVCALFVLIAVPFSA